MASYKRHEEGIKALGGKIRSLRIDKGLSQQQLAYDADIELSQVSRIERGVINTSVSQLFAIADALEVHLKTLFDFELPNDKKDHS